jgi:transcriptional regulator with XRE-family HTH domain
MATRERRGLSQRELSKLSGVPQKTISRIENGLDSPKIETLGKLASALKMKIVLVEDIEK